MRYGVRDEKLYTQKDDDRGRVTRLAVFPLDADPDGSAWLWKLELLDFEEEEWELAPELEAGRVLVSITGSPIVRIGEKSRRIPEKESLRFSGRDAAKGFGRFRGYLLSVRGDSLGFTEFLLPGEEERVLPLRNARWFRDRFQAFYCASGSAALQINGTLVSLKEGQQLISQCDGPDEQPDIRISGSGAVIRCEILASPDAEDAWEQADALFPPEGAGEEGLGNGEAAPDLSIPGSPAPENAPLSFSDFRECLFLSRIRLRGAKHFSKRYQNSWFDGELQAAMNRIDRFFLPDLIFFLGLIGCVAYGAMNMTVGITVILALCWTAVDLLLVTPLLYLAVVPRPVSRHILDLNAMSEEEQAVVRRQKNRNERAERLMKRYRVGVEYGNDKKKTPKSRKPK